MNQLDLIPEETLRERLSRLAGHDVGAVIPELFIAPLSGKRPRAQIVLSEIVVRAKDETYPMQIARVVNAKGEFLPIGFFSMH